MNGPPLIYPEPDVWPDPEAKQGSGNSRVPWSALDVLAIIGLVVVGFGIALVAVGAGFLLINFLYSDFDIESGSRQVAAIVFFWFVQWTVVLGVSVAYLKIRGYALSFQVFGFRRTAFWRAAGLLLIVSVAIIAFEAFFFQIFEPEQQPVTEIFGESLVGLVLSILIAVILTPFVEELFFRGIIHRGLAQRFGFFPGALLSSSIFAVVHLDPTRIDDPSSFLSGLVSIFVPIFVVGFGFAFLTTKTDSIWPSIASHFAFNLLAVVAQFFGDEQITGFIFLTS